MDIDWKQAYEQLKLYTHSLEQDRSTLWGVNETLQLKIKSLEAGQEDLITMLDALRSPLIEPAQLTLFHVANEKKNPPPGCCL